MPCTGTVASYHFDDATLGVYAGVGSGVACMVTISANTPAYPLMNSYGTHVDTSMDDYFNPHTINFTSSYCGCDNPHAISGSACGNVLVLLLLCRVTVCMWWWNALDLLDLMPAWVFFRDPRNLVKFTLDSYIESIASDNADIHISKRAFPAIALSIYDLQSNLTQFTKAHYTSAFADFCDNCTIFALNSYGM